MKDKHQNRRDNSKNPAKKPKKKRHILRKVVGAAAIGTVATTAMTAAGAVATWQYLTHQTRHRRSNLEVYDDVITARPYQGRVHRDAQTFTLTTAAKTYHVLDPLAIIDTLVKEQDNTSDYYDCHVCVLAEVSPKGRYGYLGHLDYQLTVTGRCEDGVASVLA